MNIYICIALMAVATIVCCIYLFATVKGSGQYQEVVEALDSPMKYSYIAGFYLLDLVHFNYNSQYSKKMVKNCQVIHGEKYAQFYFRINMAQKVTAVCLTLIAGLPLAVLFQEIIVLVLVLAAAGGFAYYFETVITDEIKKREESIIATFPDALSKLALLVNAGMIVREAWAKVADTGEGVLYEEMRNTVADMNNGLSEFDAIIAFSERCNVDKVTKFASTMVQNLSKGNKELTEFLKRFSNEAWVEKKQYARQKGEEASGKLLIPITLMFLGVLLMVVVPIFMGISF